MNDLSDFKPINKVAVFGVGLIGGSFGMAYKKSELGGQVVGYGRSEEKLRLAVELGAIDSYQLNFTQGWENVDLLLMATPVSKTIALLQRIAHYLKGGTIVTDAGSTKGGLIGAAEKILAPDKFFVGGHPIAGTEKSGVAAAFPTLFKDAKCILTPTKNTNPAALRLVGDIWRKLGSQVVQMPADKHDFALAAVSHLPHVIAYSLVNTIITLESEQQPLFSISGGGLRDFSRIAASDPSMWLDIFMDNKDYVCKAIDIFQGQITRIKTLLQQNDSETLLLELQKAQTTNIACSGDFD